MVGLDISKEAEAGARANLEANPGLSPFIDLRIRDPLPNGDSRGTSNMPILIPQAYAPCMYCNDEASCLNDLYTK